MRTPLREIAHARAGDKGDTLMLSLIAYAPAGFAAIEAQVTAAAVQAHFAALAPSRVERFVLPQLRALNFVLHQVLRGGVTRSLALDAHGKTLSGVLLDLEVEAPMGQEGRDVEER
ncbi:MAG TPA: hypothetical protein VG248_02345 [Caulobacteraceae bacterium]|jgi:hypothetical protein|nr:hypothetical protein [Caulobacteraceae bacterium]